MNTVIDISTQQQMKHAAHRLPAVAHDESIPPLEIHFLSGKRFWYQTCFCAYSLAQQVKTAVHPVIYDDGSLSYGYRQKIQKVLPNAKIVSRPAIEERLDEFLPWQHFPYLRERRLNYPHLRKLTDIHVGSQGWKLVLDSDMVFFQPPTLLLNWLEAPQHPCYMVDTETSYGYSTTVMAALTRTPIPERVNVGICGLKSDEIDWEMLEYWCKTLIDQQGAHYYQEQALIAMLIAGKACEIMPAHDYIVMPEQQEAISPKAVLHHYVAKSKSWYFRYGWQHVLQHDRASHLQEYM